jgi:hypothetical protein
LYRPRSGGKVVKKSGSSVSRFGLVGADQIAMSSFGNVGGATPLSTSEFLDRARLATAMAFHVPGGALVLADAEGRNWLSQADENYSVADFRTAVGEAIWSGSLDDLAANVGLELPLADAWFVPVSPLLVDLGRSIVRVRRDRASSWAFATLLTPDEAKTMFARVIANNEMALLRGYDEMSAVARRSFAPQLLPDDVLEATVCVFELPADAPAGVAPMYGELVRALQVESVRLAYFDAELEDLLIDWS